MTQSLRNSKYVKAPNCSVIQIRDSQVYFLKTRLYNTVDSEIDYSKGYVEFYEMDNLHSLNQAAEAVSQFKTIHLSLNIAFDVFQAFKEVDEENVERVKQLLS